MNCLLLAPDEFTASNRAQVSGGAARALIKQLKLQPGDHLRCGMIGGLLGTAVVEELLDAALVLRTELTQQPPPPHRIAVLLCALPRPKMLRRMVRSCAELGIRNIVFFNSYRVEKSYWQSAQLSPHRLQAFCIEGLQQAGDTIVPTIQLEQRFKPFVQDRLVELISDTVPLLAHPYAKSDRSQLQVSPDRRLSLAIGPEGGFIEYELEMLQKAGFQAFSCGRRVLRCDTVLPFLAGLFGQAGE